jgi:hypothetical protein
MCRHLPADQPLGKEDPKERNPFKVVPMVVAKRTRKNQLTLPKAVVEQAGQADDDDVTFDAGRIVLTPLHPGGASAVRARLQELGIRETDLADAVTRARNA